MCKNNKGFTLVEIIASITILGVVVAVLLPIFPQMISWTNNADAELVSSNLIGRVAYDVDNSNEIIEFAKNSRSCTESQDHMDEIPKSILDTLPPYQVNGEDYHVNLYTCSEDIEGLYRVNIQVLLDNRVVSDSFSYLSEGDEND